MPCDLGQSLSNIYGSSEDWLENTRMSTQPICCLYWKEPNSLKTMSYGGALAVSLCNVENYVKPRFSIGEILKQTISCNISWQLNKVKRYGAILFSTYTLLNQFVVVWRLKDVNDESRVILVTGRVLLSSQDFPAHCWFLLSEVTKKNKCHILETLSFHGFCNMILPDGTAKFGPFEIFLD